MKIKYPKNITRMTAYVFPDGVQLRITSKVKLGSIEKDIQSIGFIKKHISSSLSDTHYPVMISDISCNDHSTGLPLSMLHTITSMEYYKRTWTNDLTDTHGNPFNAASIYLRFDNGLELQGIAIPMQSGYPLNIGPIQCLHWNHQSMEMAKHHTASTEIISVDVDLDAT